MMTWVEKVEQRLNHTEKNVPWWVNDKAKLHNFAEEHGIPMPEVFRYWDEPSQLETLEDLPSRFVLKPTVMHSNWGVQLLERKEPGKYYDSLNSATYALDGIRKVQENAYSKCNYKGQYKLMAEEFVQSPDEAKPVPFDYKVYCFYDTPMLVQQVDRNGSKDKHFFFDGEFNPLPSEGYVESDWRHVELGEPVIPHDPAALLEAAVRTTVALNTPFMRVDMFHGKNGTVIGELTPAPGPLYYKKIMWLSDSFDEELGQAWELAEQKVTH